MRLAGSEATAISDPEQPRPLSIEPLTEAVVAPLLDMPTSPLEQVAAQHTQEPLAEPVEVISSDPVSLLDQASVQLIVPEQVVLTVQNIAPEAATHSPNPAFIADQTVMQTATALEFVPTGADVAPGSDAETPPLLAQDHASMSEAMVGDADVLPLSEAVVPDVEIPVVSVISAPKDLLPLSPAGSDGRHSDEPDLPLPSGDSAPAAEMAPAAERLEVPVEPPAVEPQTTAAVTTAAPEATAEDGPRILWDDSLPLEAEGSTMAATAQNLARHHLSQPTQMPAAAPTIL